MVRPRCAATLEPRLFYAYIPFRNQDNLPNFDSALADLNYAQLFTENIFSGSDRISNANQLTAALTTRILDAETGAERLRAAIAQRYYFADQLVTLPGQSPPRIRRPTCWRHSVHSSGDPGRSIWRRSIRLRKTSSYRRLPVRAGSRGARRCSARITAIRQVQTASARSISRVNGRCRIAGMRSGASTIRWRTDALSIPWPAGIPAGLLAAALRRAKVCDDSADDDDQLLFAAGTERFDECRIKRCKPSAA